MQAGGLADAPPLTRFLLTILPLSYLLATVAPVWLPHYFAFQPANVVLTHFYAWTLLTQLLLEVDLIHLIISLLCVWLVVRPTEVRIGTSRLIVFVALSVALASVILIPLCAAAYGLFGVFWMYQSSAGMLPAVAGAGVVLVHVTQGAEYFVSSTVMDLVRTRHVPFAVVLIAAGRDVWSRLIFASASDAMTEMDIGSQDEIFEAPVSLLVSTTFWISWAMVRFYGVPDAFLSASSVSACRGDSSPALALHAIVFPRPVSWVVLAASSLVFPLAKKLGIGRDIDASSTLWSGHAADGSTTLGQLEGGLLHEATATSSSAAHRLILHGSLPDSGNGGSLFVGGGLLPTSAVKGFSLEPLPGSSAADADRRRAVALAALTARLQQIHKSGTAAGGESDLNFSPFRESGKGEDTARGEVMEEEVSIK